MRGDNLLFKTQLRYQINSAAEAINDEVSIDELKDINLHNCYHKDFKKVMTYIRDNYPDYYFGDATIEAVKPRDFSEVKKYDFIELAEYAKHTAITIGNMSLFCELQKLSSAAELANLRRNEMEVHKDNYTIGNISTFGDYVGYGVMEELGSLVIGGGNNETLKLTATFHESSQESHPIVSIRSYSITSGLYSINRDIIDLTEIYKPNASLMEAFAYMCYEDYLDSQKHNTSWSPASKSFDKFLSKTKINIESIEDMYALHYDLRVFDMI